MESSSKKLFYIIGAGSAGVSLFHDIKMRFPRSIIVFLDDDEKKAGIAIGNATVMAPIEKSLQILNPTANIEVIIAMPSAPAKRIQSIYKLLKKYSFSNIRILPSPLSYLDSPHFVQTQKINLENLLLRDTITLPNKQALSYLRNKRILITGAGGSIGSELAEQLLYAGVSRMYLLGHGEYSIYKITKKLQMLQQRGVGEHTYFIPILCELTDKNAVNHIVSKLEANVIFHTAAYKHIDLIEENAPASIGVNIFGTKFLLDAIQRNKNTEHFVLVSTDKAVEPASVYGVSKLVSEKLTLGLGIKNIRTSVMRFGNVIGSRGSVLPLFQEQISMGGPITITSQKCKRYFMTLSEACSLMLYAMQIKKRKNNELFILEMGKQVSVMEVAQQMLDFYGLERDKDISFVFTGLRPGEKEQETLVAADEKKHKSSLNHVYLVTRKSKHNSFLDIDSLLEDLYDVCFYNPHNIKKYRNNNFIAKIMKKHIKSFVPLYKKQKRILK